MRYRKTYGTMNEVRIIDTESGQLISMEKYMATQGPMEGSGMLDTLIKGVTSKLAKNIAQTAAVKATESLASHAGKKIGEAVLGKGTSDFSDTLIKRK